jgi:hypothetical protein
LAILQKPLLSPERRKLADISPTGLIESPKTAGLAAIQVDPTLAEQLGGRRQGEDAETNAGLIKTRGNPQELAANGK